MSTTRRSYAEEFEREAVAMVKRHMLLLLSSIALIRANSFALGEGSGYLGQRKLLITYFPHRFVTPASG